MENEKKRKCLRLAVESDARMSAKCLFTPGHGVLLPDTGIYTCPTCNALFTCLQYYQQHVQRHAEVNGNKLLCCNHCRYSTDNQFHYNWHIMSHTGEPPHSCNVCNKPPETALNSTSNHIKSETETDDDVTYAMTGKRSVATATNDDIVLMPSSPMSCRLSGKEDQNRNCSATQAGSYASTTTQVKSYLRYSQASDEDEDEDDDEDDEEEEIEEEEDTITINQTQNGTTNTSVATASQDDDDISDEDDEEEEVESEEDDRDAEYVVPGIISNYQIQGPPYTKSPTSTPSSIPAPVENSTGRGRGKGNRKSRTLNMLESGVDGSVAGELRRKFHCSHCGKSFKTKSHLQRHILTHTGEKPYHCNRCGSKFNQSSSLRNHIIAIHTKEYPHYCPQCGKGFLMPALLHKHLATSHRSK